MLQVGRGIMMYALFTNAWSAFKQRVERGLSKHKHRKEDLFVHLRDTVSLSTVMRD